ncbi:hypothetical protein F2Q70_00018803 [Brassica cretica]|uniref:Uncharacterized protein n=1 Tax=Brassica cretica TaxID=69181 RepID=A0A8S9I088_BRACR|nr:hypothetical protein F2Q70_00018803 [Brassica cretica]
MSTMNFSHNLLEGPVPKSTQFQGQSCSSFMDNLKLYGLEDICGEETHVKKPVLEVPEKEEQVVNWIAAKRYGDCVGGSNTKVIVTMSAEDNIINSRSVFFDVSHKFPVFVRHVDPHRVRAGQGGCTRFDRYFKNLAYIILVGPA